MPVRLVPQTRARVAMDGGGPAWDLPPSRARTCMKPKSNHSIQRTGACRSGRLQFVRQWRLAPAADAERWAAGQAAKAPKPQRGDMFIARQNRNLRKPRRGGMVLSRTGHAAPTGRAERIGGAVTRNRPPAPVVGRSAVGANRFHPMGRRLASAPLHRTGHRYRLCRAPARSCHPGATGPSPR